MNTQPTQFHLPPTLLASLQQEAAEAYPNECCGFLLGTVEQGEGRHVHTIRPAANAAGSTAARRYRITPGDYLHVDRDARAQGLDIVGIYHSHPDCPAVPSATDLEEAWPQYLYLIIAVQDGQPAECNGWVLDEATPDGSRRFRAVKVELES